MHEQLRGDHEELKARFAEVSSDYSVTAQGRQQLEAMIHDLRRQLAEADAQQLSERQYHLAKEQRLVSRTQDQSLSCEACQSQLSLRC